MASDRLSAWQASRRTLMFSTPTPLFLKGWKKMNVASRSPKRGLGTTGKLSAVLAGGAAMGAAGHANASLVYTALNTTIDTSTSTKSVIIDQPTIGNGLDGKAIFDLSVSTTSGLTDTKPSTGNDSPEYVFATSNASGAPFVAYPTGSLISLGTAPAYTITSTSSSNLLISADGTQGQFGLGTNYIGFDATPNLPGGPAPASPGHSQEGPNYYGWLGVDVTVDSPSEVAATITGIALDNTAEQGVIAGSLTPAVPEPTSLGLLAIGAIGLAAYRQRRA